MVNVTITLRTSDAELLQKAADNMTAWSASQGMNTVWTIEDYLRVGALQQAKADLSNYSRLTAK